MLHSKIVSLDEAVACVPAGATLTAGGFAHSNQPLGFMRALIRTARTPYSLISVAECWVAEYLAAAGLLERTWFSNFMFEGFGRCRAFSRGVEEGRIMTEDHSHYGVVTRLRAGGQRLPFLPMGAMAGTDTLARPGFEAPSAKAARLPSPFGNGETTVLSPLVPDVAIIHAARADAAGNVQLFGTSAVIAEQAKAARHVIVTVEEIVPTEVIRRQPELTLLPAILVDHVVHLPYGAHPTGVYGYYDHDPHHLGLYYDASRTAEGIGAWLERWVFGLPDHFAYLDAVSLRRLIALRVDPALGYVREASR